MTNPVFLPKFATALVAAGLIFVASVPVSAQAPIEVLLVTGQNNRAHNWEVSSPIVRRHLETPGGSW